MPEMNVPDPAAAFSGGLTVGAEQILPLMILGGVFLSYIVGMLLSVCTDRKPVRPCIVALRVQLSNIIWDIVHRTPKKVWVNK